MIAYPRAVGFPPFRLNLFQGMELGFMIVFSLGNSQQSIQNLWIFKLNLLLYRFDHVLLLHQIFLHEFSLKKRQGCYGNSSPLKLDGCTTGKDCVGCLVIPIQYMSFIRALNDVCI